MNKKTIRDIDVSGKRVLLRTDYNVQVDERGVLDDRRLRESLPTIETLRDAGAKIIIVSHRGRPRGEVVESLRNAPVAAHLAMLLRCDVATARDCIGPEARAAVDALQPGSIVVLENVRFHAEEEANDPGFARELASLADIFVNDAFGTAHRAHASVAAITECLPSVAGLLMEREVEYLEKVTVNPERPLGLIFGGAKMSDKILILENLLDKADVICVGGGMANTFLKAQGHDVARSLVEDDRLDVARDILDRAARRSELRFVLPSDVVVSIGDPQEWNVRSVPVSEVPTGWRILDVGHETIEDFREALQPVKTAMWNGPLGLFEQARFAEGSLALAHILADLNATTVIGGGETAAVATRAGVAERISHISTGGGASLEMLEGKTLPGVAALLDR